MSGMSDVELETHWQEISGHTLHELLTAFQTRAIITTIDYKIYRLICDLREKFLTADE